MYIQASGMLQKFVKQKPRPHNLKRQLIVNWRATAKIDRKRFSPASWSTGSIIVSEAKVWGSNLGPVKPDMVLPTARYRCNISSTRAVLSGRNGAEMGPANSIPTSAYCSEYNKIWNAPQLNVSSKSQPTPPPGLHCCTTTSHVTQQGRHAGPPRYHHVCPYHSVLQKGTYPKPALLRGFRHSAGKGFNDVIRMRVHRSAIKINNLAALEPSEAVEFSVANGNSF